MEFAQHSQVAFFPEILNVQNNSAIINNVPPGFENVSVEFIRNNLAVIPGEWDIAELTTTFYNLQTDDSILAANLAQIKAADFIAWDESFFDFIGTSAAIEIILSFPGVQHVHEAPVYVPESNELLFSDTSALGWLWGLNLDTYETRNITTKPPLYNVNGGTSRNGNIYFTTNGSPVRGIHVFNPKDGTTVPILNNYRGRHLNSPNDLVVDSKGNIWFTDPAYGWYQSWPGVQAPELPNSIYFFNTTSKALITVSNSVVLVPNGLAFSEDESILYVSDSNSTSGRPLQTSHASQRNVWAFDVSGTSISNPRLVHVAEAGWPDGIRITSNGFLMVTVFGGIDVVDPKSGLLLGRINTPDDIIFNVEPIPGTGTWLLTGLNHIYKVTLAEKALLR